MFLCRVHKSSNLPLQTFSFPCLLTFLTLKWSKWITSCQNATAERRIDRLLEAFLSCKNNTLTPVFSFGCLVILFHGLFVSSVKSHFGPQQKYVWIHLSIYTTRELLFLEWKDRDQMTINPFLAVFGEERQPEKLMSRRLRRNANCM